MDRDRDIDSLLAEVLDQPVDARERYLEARCGNDVELRAELQRLIREADDHEPFLKSGGAFDGP